MKLYSFIFERPRLQRLNLVEFSSFFLFTAVAELNFSFLVFLILHAISYEPGCQHEVPGDTPVSY